MEGGTRVPLIVTRAWNPTRCPIGCDGEWAGHYPTLLALTGTKSPKGLKLDGCNLKPLLKDPTDPTS